MGETFKGIRKMIIGIVIFGCGFYLHLTKGDGQTWMWLGAGVAVGGNVYDFIVGHLKIGN